MVKNVSPAEAGKLLQADPNITVLDVRTPEEFAAGHIAGAKNIDFTDPNFAKNLAALDKTKPYLVHCAGGGRSTQALPKLEGFSAVYHLDRGFNGWQKAGLPVTK